MRRLALLVVICSLLAAACGGNGPDFDESAAREVAPLTAGVEADPLTLRIGVPAEMSLDPAAAGPASLSARVLAGLLYEGLVHVDDDGFPVAGLAERWFVSDDRLTWTFVLPQDLVDGDGAPIAARDVKQSLERVAARGPADQSATALTSVFGWADHMNGASGGVAGISAPDPTTLVIRLDRPDELLIDALASPAFGITGELADGSLRTTGGYRLVEDGNARSLEALDEGANVRLIELVPVDDAPAAVADGTVDWVVLAPGDDSTDLPADVVRQPLDLEVVVVARMPSAEERRGVLAALEPIPLANSVDAVTARARVAATGDSTLPAAAVVEVPEGGLQPLGEAIVGQLEAAGIEVIAVASTASDFAARVDDGRALVFPILVAGGATEVDGLLRVGTPGATDDVFGADSTARAELAVAVTSEMDSEQRTLFADALEREMIDAGHLLPVGGYEVRVAVGDGVSGLRHNADGTLDLENVAAAE